MPYKAEVSVLAIRRCLLGELQLLANVSIAGMWPDSAVAAAGGGAGRHSNFENIVWADLMHSVHLLLPPM